MENNPVIIYAKSNRLTLRHLCTLDIPAIQTYCSDFDISKWTGWFPHPLSDDFALNYIKHTLDRPTKNDKFNFAIVENASQTIVGTAGYFPIVDNRIEIGYWIGKVYWSCGYATKAVRMMIDYLYDEKVIEQKTILVGSYQIDNSASINVLEKLGFRHCNRPTFAIECVARGGQVQMQSMEYSREDDPKSKLMDHPSAKVYVDTSRFRLCHLHPNDASLMQEYLNDWEVAKWLSHVPYPYKNTDALEFINSQPIDPSDHFTFAIVAKDQNQFIGIVAYGPIDPNHHHLEADHGGTTIFIGYWFGRAYWNHGYATEAAKAIISFLYQQYNGIDLTIVSSHFDENTALAKVLKKLGFCYRKEKCEMMSESLSREESVPARRMELRKDNFTKLTI